MSGRVAGGRCDLCPEPLGSTAVKRGDGLVHPDCHWAEVDRQRGALVDPDEARAAAEVWSERDEAMAMAGACEYPPRPEPGTVPIEDATGCVRADADPGCYGCLGTGELQWAGVTERHVRCMCRWRCATHDAHMGDEDFCDVGERAL